MKLMSGIKAHWGWSALLVLVMYSPLLWLGDQVFIAVRDGLECEVIWLHLLKMNGHLWSGANAVVNETMGGLEARHFHSPLNLNRLVFASFNSIRAYAVLSMLYRLMAAWGAWKLIEMWKRRSNAEMDGGDVLLVAGFACMMTQNLYGLSALGLPLLWACLVSVRGNDGTKAWVWVSLAVFGFVSHFAMVLLVAFVMWTAVAIGALRNWDRSEFVRLVFAGFVLVSGLALGSYMQIIDTVGGSVESHRVQRIWEASWWEFSWTQYVAMNGHYHSGKLPLVFALVVLVVCVIWSSLRKKRGALVLLSWIGAYLGVVVFFHAAKPLTGAMGIDFFHQFDLQRVHFLLPFLSFVMVSRAVWLDKRVRFLVALLWLGLVVLKNNELRSNWKQGLLGRGSHVQYVDRLIEPTIWNRVKEDVPALDMAGMAGIPTWVAQWNGVSTLGGYQNDYPLAYKLKYRRILEREFLKDDHLAHRFDIWGNKCWLQSAHGKSAGIADMAFRRYLPDGFVLKQDWDFDAMRDLGCSHVISGYPVESDEMQLVGEYPGYFWDIHVYELN